MEEIQFNQKMNNLEQHPKTPEFKVLKPNSPDLENNDTQPYTFIISKESNVQKWTTDEDNKLLELSELYKFKSWKKIAEHLPGRTHVQCSARYKRIIPGVIKGAWTESEDQELIRLLGLHGKNWAKISNFLKTRSGKQIRDRYLNTLRPGINKQKFTDEEDSIILTKYKEIGAKWSVIVGFLQNRTSDSIKNRFYTSLRKKHYNIDYLRQKKVRQELTTPGKILEISINPLVRNNAQSEEILKSEESQKYVKSPNSIDNEDHKKIASLDCLKKLSYKNSLNASSSPKFSPKKDIEIENTIPQAIYQHNLSSQLPFQGITVKKVPLKNKILIADEDIEKYLNTQSYCHTNDFPFQTTDFNFFSQNFSYINTSTNDSKKMQLKLENLNTTSSFILFEKDDV